MTSLMLAGLLGGLAVGAFYRLERRGRGHWIIGLILAELLVELYLYPSQNEIPAGIFRVYLLGQSMRLPELLIIAGLTARVLARGVRMSVSTYGLAWAMFGAWYGLALVTGMLHDNPTSQALYSFRAVILLGGGLVLAAGVGVRPYLRPRVVSGWLLVVAAGALASVPSTLANDAAAQDAGKVDELPEGWPPLLAGARLGVIGADLATVLVAVGVVAVLLAAAGAVAHRLPVGLAGIALLAVPFVVGQRAAVAGGVVCILLVLATVAGGIWRRRLRLGGVGVTVAAVLVIGTGLAVAPFIPDDGTPDGDGASVIETLHQIVNPAQVQSGETRLLLWHDAAARVRTEPVVGSGLGTTYRIVPARAEGTLSGVGFHNIYLDVAVRAGLLGLLFFGIAIAMTTSRGLRVWRRHPDPRVAALAVAVLICLAGFATKGLAESVFEKYRLVAFVGLLIGVLGAAVADRALARGPGISPDHVRAPASPRGSRP